MHGKELAELFLAENFITGLIKGIHANRKGKMSIKLNMQKLNMDIISKDMDRI